ncbi:MAG TPA: glutathione S-transferase family protein [Candidatus Eisenbacteria bacterium]|nr:glutathione S-transferase family protein [Candidatus Eisenbacteria bacterium]
MLRFFFASGSPFAWRVHLALVEKAIEHQAVLLSFQAGDLKKAEYVAISPHAKVPALVAGDLALYESQPILEYLEDRHPAPPLLPSDPAGRALVRIEETECTLYFFEAFSALARQVFFTPADERDQKAIDAGRAAVRAQLGRVDGRAAKRGGDFVMGKTFTRADTSWLPFVELAGRAGIDVGGVAPWIGAWRDRMRARPSYDKTYPPHWRTSPPPV